MDHDEGNKEDAGKSLRADGMPEPDAGERLYGPVARLPATSMMPSISGMFCSIATAPSRDT